MESDTNVDTNTNITNSIHEAFGQQFNITARPRLVALPPRPPSDTG